MEEVGDGSLVAQTCEENRKYTKQWRLQRLRAYITSMKIMFEV